MLWPVVSQTFSGIDNNQCCPQFYAHDPTTNARNASGGHFKCEDSG